MSNITIMDSISTITDDCRAARLPYTNFPFDVKATKPGETRHD